MMSHRVKPQHIDMAAHLAASIFIVALVLVTFAGSFGLVVIVWRWMLNIIRGGCA